MFVQWPVAGIFCFTAYFVSEEFEDTKGNRNP
jgi:hypothetical protein